MILPNERAGRSKLTQFSTTFQFQQQLLPKKDPGPTRIDTDVEPWRDDTAFVQSSVELDDDLPCSVVVDDFKLANVACSLSVHVPSTDC